MPRLTSEQIRKGLKISVWEGAFATVHLTLTSGIFLVGYALLLGVNDFQLGLLAALPFLAQMVQPLAAFLVQNLARRKPFTLTGAVFFRGIWILLVFLPFIFLVRNHKIVLFLSIIAISAVANNFATVAWLSWMADLVPQKIRGRYFGIRNTILQVVTICVYFAGAKLIDHYKALKPDQLSQKLFDFSGFGNMSVLGFGIIFTLAVIAALVAGVLLYLQPEPSFHHFSNKAGLKDLLFPFKDKDYRKFIRFLVWWSLCVGIAAPFWGAHMLRNLHLDYYLISLFSILAGTISLVFQPFWGKMIDRYGCKPVLRFNLIFILFIPYLWFFITPQNYFLLWVDAVMGGIFWAGFNLAMFTIVLQISPQEGRPFFLASAYFVSGLFTFLASLIGGIIANQLAMFKLQIYGQTLVNFHILFLLSALGRLWGLFVLGKVVEPESKPVGQMVSELGYYFGNKFPGGAKVWEKIEEGLRLLGYQVGGRKENLR
ncbi:MAG: MFS transporter [candidate division Zixibacteria bacterium]|nr:MFS transporter [candidate division Zixibacteria bacterium]